MILTMHSCDRAAHLASHHLSFCVHLWDCPLHLWASHMNNAPTHATALASAVMIPPSFSVSLLSVCLPVCLCTSEPCMGSIKTVSLPFSSWALVAALCMWGASKRSSLYTSYEDFIWFDKILFWGAKLKEFPPPTPAPTPAPFPLSS